MPANLENSTYQRMGKGQFAFQSQRKAMPKSAQTTTQLHSSHTKCPLASLIQPSSVSLTDFLLLYSFQKSPQTLTLALSSSHALSLLGASLPIPVVSLPVSWLVSPHIYPFQTYTLSSRICHCLTALLSWMVREHFRFHMANPELLTKVKEESENFGLKFNIQKTKIMVSSPITSWQIDGETRETVRFYFLGGQVSHGSAGEYQPDEQAGVARLRSQVAGRWAGRCRAGPLPSIRQMSGQRSRGSVGAYQADERAAVARLCWRVSGR